MVSKLDNWTRIMDLFMVGWYNHYIWAFIFHRLDNSENGLSFGLARWTNSPLDLEDGIVLYRGSHMRYAKWRIGRLDDGLDSVPCLQKQLQPANSLVERDKVPLMNRLIYPTIFGLLLQKMTKILSQCETRTILIISWKMTSMRNFGGVKCRDHLDDHLIIWWSFSLF